RKHNNLTTIPVQAPLDERVAGRAAPVVRHLAPRLDERHVRRSHRRPAEHLRLSLLARPASAVAVDGLAAQTREETTNQSIVSLEHERCALAAAGNHGRRRQARKQNGSQAARPSFQALGVRSRVVHVVNHNNTVHRRRRGLADDRGGLGGRRVAGPRFLQHRENALLIVAKGAQPARDVLAHRSRQLCRVDVHDRRCAARVAVGQNNIHNKAVDAHGDAVLGTRAHVIPVDRCDGVQLGCSALLRFSVLCHP
ncbi:unnamed protein product, partial [Pelagomonas calceolata]